MNKLGLIRGEEMTTKNEILRRVNRMEEKNTDYAPVVVDTEEEFQKYRNYPGIVICDDIPRRER